MKPIFALLSALLAFAAAPAPAAPAGAPADSSVVPAASARHRTAPRRAAVAAPADSATREDAQIRAALDRMVGVIPGSDTLVAWELFRAHAHRTVDLILPTLTPVRRDLWLGAPNMVWRVRVLQRLTGLEFRGRTRAKLSEDERLHLAPDSSRAVRFAGEERALGMTWTAPADAQKDVITRWRQWWTQGERKPELPLQKHGDDRTWWY